MREVPPSVAPHFLPGHVFSLLSADHRQFQRMFRRSEILKRIVRAWPGKKTFGLYRFMPIFFVLGAALEFSMINWHVGEVNFYRVYKRRQISEKVQQLAYEET
ncbi:Hypothetical predicted protein [Octopus vulgaris]|uniref:Small integral membrane protein 4 n=1 Tax=Octopus vulgaris TaxID=6645 RepID=A0AA36C1G1_OCTVU|nr:Hypothetical predicted protein [Octopus vulgaris]